MPSPPDNNPSEGEQRSGLQPTELSAAAQTDCPAKTFWKTFLKNMGISVSRRQRAPTPEDKKDLIWAKRICGSGRRKLPVQKRREDASHSESCAKAIASHQGFRTKCFLLAKTFGVGVRWVRAPLLSSKQPFSAGP